MTIELRQHFVAFLDILGFSDMVREDVKQLSRNHLQKLYRCHQLAPSVFCNDPGLTVTQFSDSIMSKRTREIRHFLFR